MANFIGVYSVPAESLAAAIRSKSPSKLEELLAAAPSLRADERKRKILARLIDGDFAPGESDDGAGFVYAFEAVCRAYATSSTVAEIHIDDETFPEIWAFAWDAAEVEFGLPESEYGTPAARYWDREGVRNYVAVLEALDFAELHRRTDRDLRDEIAGVLEVLKAADAADRGVYLIVTE